MIVEICIGSSCHIKGAYDVIENLKKLIEDNNLESQITLKACFCMGHCGKGVSVRINNDDITWLTPQTCNYFFEKIVKELPNATNQSPSE